MLLCTAKTSKMKLIKFVISVNIIINFKLFKNFNSLMDERKTMPRRAKETKVSASKFWIEKIKLKSKIDDIIFTRGSTLCTGELLGIYLPKVKFCNVYFSPLFLLLILKFVLEVAWLMIFLWVYYTLFGL